jgi:hypothetical protein
MTPEYRRPPTADTIYIYKDGPLHPDPQLSGEEQLAQQKAYIDLFTTFEKDRNAAGTDNKEDEEDWSVSGSGKSTGRALSSSRTYNGTSLMQTSLMSVSI